MELTELPLPPEFWAATPAAAQPLIVALQARVRELAARVGQNASNASRPPASDPPHVPPKPQAVPSGRPQGRSLLDSSMAVGKAALRGSPAPSLLPAPPGD
jgi:Family of unknown function (DUF6444)